MSSKYDIVKLHIDTMGFSSKPGSGEKGNRIPAIISRASRNIVQITKEELVERVLGGYSFMPGVCPMSDDAKKKYCGGNKQVNWEQQQIFALDFDSAIDKGMMESHMDEILEELKELGIVPFFAYSSFTDGKFVVDRNVEKFRVVFATKEVVTDIELHDKLQATLMGLFSEQIDKQCSNRNRYYNGTKLDARTYLDYDAVIDAEWIVNTYWDDAYVEHTPSDSSLRKKASNSKKAKENTTENNVKKCNRKSTNKTYEIEDRGNVVPFTRANKKNIRHDLNMMGKVFELRSWKEEERRERFVFIYYFDAVLLYGFEKALEMVSELHEKMEEQLTDREFYYAITRANEYIDRFIEEDNLRPYSRKKIASELWLTKEEIEECGIFKTKEKNARAEKRRPIRLERNEFVIGLSKNGSLDLWEIKEMANRYYPEVALKSEKQIRRIISASKKEDIFPQTTTTIYTSSTLNEEEPIFVNDEPTLNEEQQVALDDALCGNNLVISGNGGGVGKSLLIRKIVEALEGRGKTVAVTAATALAAENVDGVTLHRAMKMYFDEDSIVTSNMIYNAKQYDTIVIDEASMVGAKTFECFCKIIEEVRHRYHKYIQVILVCDVLQLPPVNDRYFFQTECYENLQCNLHYLSENYRQNGDNTYLNLINKVRIEEDKTLVACELNRICNHSEDARYTYLTSRKSDAFVLNQRHLNNLEGEFIDLGNLCVKIRAKVIVTENNSRAGYYNGMQGVVRSIENNVVTIVTTKGMTVKIHRKSMLVNDEYVLGYPLDLGYAITIHKSQGMTLEGANINPQCFDCGQLYVALSRVKSASGVHLLKPIRPEYIKVNGDALAFDETMREESFRRRQVAM